MNAVRDPCSFLCAPAGFPQHCGLMPCSIVIYVQSRQYEHCTRVKMLRALVQQRNVFSRIPGLTTRQPLSANRSHLASFLRHVSLYGLDVRNLNVADVIDPAPRHGQGVVSPAKRHIRAFRSRYPSRLSWLIHEQEASQAATPCRDPMPSDRTSAPASFRSKLPLSVLSQAAEPGTLRRLALTSDICTPWLVDFTGHILLSAPTSARTRCKLTSAMFNPKKRMGSSQAGGRTLQT